MSSKKILLFMIENLKVFKRFYFNSSISRLFKNSKFYGNPVTKRLNNLKEKKKLKKLSKI